MRPNSTPGLASGVRRKWPYAHWESDWSEELNVVLPDIFSNSNHHRGHPAMVFGKKRRERPADQWRGGGVEAWRAKGAREHDPTWFRNFWSLKKIPSLTMIKLIIVFKQCGAGDVRSLGPPGRFHR